MPGDWIKLHRKVVDSAVFSDEGVFSTFVALLLAVNWKPGWFKMQKIEPGQMAFSWRKLPERLHSAQANPPSVNTMRARVAKLCAHGVVTVEKKGQKFSVITICNWSTYQHGVSDVDTIADTTVDTHPDTHPDTLTDTDRRRVRKKEGKKGRTTTPKPPIEFPPALDSEAFKAAWDCWLRYKAEIRSPYKTAQGQQNQLSRIAKWGEQRAVSAIEYSIGQEYKGIYEESRNGTGGSADDPRGNMDAVQRRLQEIDNEQP